MGDFNARISRVDSSLYHKRKTNRFEFLVCSFFEHLFIYWVSLAKVYFLELETEFSIYERNYTKSTHLRKIKTHLICISLIIATLYAICIFMRENEVISSLIRIQFLPKIISVLGAGCEQFMIYVLSNQELCKTLSVVKSNFWQKLESGHIF